MSPKQIVDAIGEALFLLAGGATLALIGAWILVALGVIPGSDRPFWP